MTEAEWENMLANAKKIDTKPKAGQKRAANHGISDSEVASVFLDMRSMKNYIYCANVWV